MSDLPALGSELRENPLTDGFDEVIISPDRANRPWRGEKVPEEAELSPYDPQCALCPGNARQKGVNPPYESTHTFVNDSPALVPKLAEPEHEPESGSLVKELFQRKRRAYGICEVNLYTPRHDETLNRMTLEGIVAVIEMLREQYQRLGSNPLINYIAQFETRGKELGNSQPHPHGQTWASEHIPPKAASEFRRQKELSDTLGRNALLAYISEVELEADERVVYQNDNFAVVVPWWAELPYETMIVPTKPASSLEQLDNDQITDFAKSIWVVTNGYAKLFEQPKYGAAYYFGIRQSPTDGGDYSHFQMHAEFKAVGLVPGQSKIRAAYEELNGKQNDVLPEQAAQKLKGVISGLVLPWAA